MRYDVCLQAAYEEYMREEPTAYSQEWHSLCNRWEIESSDLESLIWNVSFGDGEYDWLDADELEE
jgi:hypothetical protein